MFNRKARYTIIEAQETETLQYIPMTLIGGDIDSSHTCIENGIRAAVIATLPHLATYATRGSLVSAKVTRAITPRHAPLRAMAYDVAVTQSDSRLVSTFRVIVAPR